MSWETSSLCLVTAVSSSLRRCLWWVVVAGWVLWGGAQAKVYACLQANDGDAFGRRFPSWRHHSFAPFPGRTPMAGRLIGGSSCIPASLHLHCRPGSLGRGGCFAVLVRCLLLLADGGSLALADALPLCSCCLVDALPPVVTSCLADALPPFLLWRILCRRGCAFRWMLFLPSPASWLRQYFMQVLLFGWPLFGRLVWRVPPSCFFCCPRLRPFVSLFVLFL